MDIVKIQTLIAQGKVVELADIDPTQSFVQIGIYQPDNRKIGSANNAYPPFVIPLSELGGSGEDGLNTLNATVNLNTLDVQPLFTLPTGQYIIENAYLSGASVDTSSLPCEGLNIFNSGVIIPSGTTSGTLFSSTAPGPCSPAGCDEILNYMFVPQNYAKMYNIGGSCFPPPCNTSYTLTGDETINAQMTNVAGVVSTINVTLCIRKIG